MYDPNVAADDRNPYAAPEANLEIEQPVGEPNSAVYYALSPLKLMILSTLTFGFYELWFWWRQWGVRRAGGADVSVFWRTVLAPFFAFDFRAALVLRLRARGLAVSPLLAAVPTVYLLSSFLARGLINSSNATLGMTLFALVATVLRAFTLFTLQANANRVLEADGYSGPVNRGASVGACIGGGLGAIIWLLNLVGGLLPDP